MAKLTRIQVSKLVYEKWMVGGVVVGGALRAYGLNTTKSFAIGGAQSATPTPTYEVDYK